MANSSQEKRRQLLGDRLYSRVILHDKNQPRRTTGVLLDMETSELLFLLENDEKLKAKVEEAKIVLNKKDKDLSATEQVVIADK